MVTWIKVFVLLGVRLAVSTVPLWAAARLVQASQEAKQQTVAFRDMIRDSELILADREE